MAKFLLFYLLCSLLFAIGSAKDDQAHVLLIGNEQENYYKRPILQHFYPNTNFDDIFNNDNFIPNIVVFGSQSEHIELEYSKFYKVHSNVTLILTLKSADKLNLNEIQWLHKYIYQISGPFVAIEIGVGTIQTRSLLDYSAFCWANGHLRNQLIGSRQNQVFLCNSAKPSSLSTFVDEQTIVPLNREIEPTILPITPQPRFWPSITVSAADTESKKQRGSKHTTQPNPRQVKVYGKGKAKSGESNGNSEEQESEKLDKLGCKYRKSCYSGQDPPVVIEKPTEKSKEETKKSESKSKKNEDDSAEVEVKSTDDKLSCKYRKSCYVGEDPPPIVEVKKPIEIENREVNKFAKDDSKLACKYRHSCYSETGIEAEKEVEQKLVDESNHESKVESKSSKIKVLDEKPSKIESKVKIPDEKLSKSQSEKQTKRDSKNDERQYDVQLDDNPDLKVQCKYRKSCYKSGKLDLEAIQSEKHYMKQQEEKKADSKIEVDLDKEDSKLQCKYRKSCYESGILDLNQINDVKQKEEKKTDSKIDVDLDKEDSKLQCKYRKSCYESGTLDLKKIHGTQHESKSNEGKTDSKIEVDLDKEDSKLQCKYRKSCYETGTLDLNQINDVKHQVQEETVEDLRSLDEKTLKFKCKYRKSCFEEQSKDDSSEEVEKEESDIEERGEEVKIPIVVEELDNEESVEEENVDESVEEEEPEIVMPIPEVSKNTAKKSKEATSEIKKKDPNRYVNKFKTIGKYEKIPKSSIIDEEEITEESDDNEDDSVSVEISEPIHPTIEEEDESSEVEEIEEPEIVVPPTENEEIENEESEESEESHENIPVHVKIGGSVEEKLECKYRKSCYETGKLYLEAEKENARIKPIIVEDSKKSNEEFDKLRCKYRRSCYSQFDTEKEEVESKIVKKKQESSEKLKETPKQKIDEDEKVNQTVVVDLNSISVPQKLNCKYRTSCYGEINPPTEQEQQRPTQVIPIPLESLRIKNSKCNKYYLSCREDLGLPPKEYAPKMNGRRLCRKKKPSVSS